MNRASQRKVVKYYQSLGSRIGYTFITHNSKHFGFHKTGSQKYDYKKAELKMMDFVGQSLELKKTDTVLDAGCGRGVTACYLAKKYLCKISGIDLVPFELKIADKLKTKLNLKNVKFEKQDYSHANFPDNYFDKIYTLETLVHSPDFRKTLKEFRRILKTHGRVIFLEYTRSNPKEFTSKERQMIKLINEGSAMTSFSKMYHQDFPQKIKESGFKIISDRNITDNVMPTLAHFYSFAKFPYKIIDLLSLNRLFVNTTAAVEFYSMSKKGLVQYRAILAEKV